MKQRCHFWEQETFSKLKFAISCTQPIYSNEQKDNNNAFRVRLQFGIKTGFLAQVEFSCRHNCDSPLMYRHEVFCIVWISSSFSKVRQVKLKISKMQKL